MVFGMTMIKVKPGRENAAYQALQTIRGLKELYTIFGEFNFFLIANAYGRRDLDRILEEIRMTDGVVEICPVLVTSESELSDIVLTESEESVLI
jgi:hypothetical protein